MSEEFKLAATNLCVMLARHYDPNAKDRLSLWEHIAKALSLACEKIDNGDIEAFITLCLESVRADHAFVISNEQSAELISLIASANESWRLGLIQYIRTHSYVVLVHGRAAWQAEVAEKQEARKAGAA